MKKNKIVIFIVIVILCSLIICINGINIAIAGAFSLSTKYYKTPQEAFTHVGDNLPTISQYVDFIQIDDYNGLFIGITNENELEKYILISMQTRNNKYFFSGFYSILDDSTISDDIRSEGNRIYLYTKWGFHQGQFEYFIIYDEMDLQKLDENFKVYHITSELDKEFYLAYRMI